MSLKIRVKSRTISSLRGVVDSKGASSSTNLDEVIVRRKIFLELIELRFLMKVKRKKAE